MSRRNPRATGLQAFALSLLGLLDTAARELRRDEYEVLLEILAVRLGRDFVQQTLDNDRHNSHEDAA